MMRVEPGRQCDHPLEAVGRHRVCRECAAVYMAVAGPNEVVLLGGYAAVLALHDEYRALSAAQQQPAGDAEQFRSALEHIRAITAPEMIPLYSVRPHECSGVSAHKIAKCALEAAAEARPRAPAPGLTAGRTEQHERDDEPPDRNPGNHAGARPDAR